ncbi:unnamed protein product [Pseudo-nitzschia multistriata]|uniref:UBA domain-containing protein n=1 Tax=Pseudo-nitzschia multistriata TaxID=183589 RepID=A0A448ZPD4_9STRA|nr:unnamed protein product [Pseudo-nitzschia multistriata]
MIRQAMNPQAIRSMLEMQRAMGGGTGGGMDFSSLLGGGPASGTPTSSSSSPQDLSSVMEQMRAMMGGAAATGGAAGFSNPWLQPQTQPQQTQPPQHPADRYRSQLESLRAMGFDDERRCLELLQRHHGNLNRAVDALLSEPEAQAPQVEAAATTEAPTEAQAQAPLAANDPSPEPPLHDPKDARDKKDD